VIGLRRRRDRLHAAPATVAGTERPLLSVRDLRKLERLSIVSQQAILAGISGQRASGAGSAGLEFVDYRPYVAGDDLRYVDWNVHARLRELLVKVAPEERRAKLDILIDLSRSMDFGEHNKLWHARRVAVTLGAIALLHSDVVRTYGLAGAEVVRGPRLDTPNMVDALSRQVAELAVSSQTELPSAVRAYRRLREPADLVVLLSDGLVPPPALAEALTELAEQTPSVAFIHVVDASELRAPARGGSLELRDSETGRVMDLAPSSRAAVSYEQLAERFRAGVQRSVRAVGARYLLAPTELDALDLLAAGARSEGLVAS
jgi:uncharacterized protein (DUF58 family)